MSGYEYTPRQLAAWPPEAQAAVAWERLLNAEHNEKYWRGRCIVAERRLRELHEGAGAGDES